LTPKYPTAGFSIVVKFPPNLAWVLVALAASLTSACSTLSLAENRAPSAAARLVQKWAFVDFARDVEGKGADVKISSPTIRLTDTPVVLVPIPTISTDAFGEMKKLSLPGDEVLEFVDAWDGRYFFCLTRAGQIVKTYQFENRASHA
jgi:hypothetical protein